MSESKHCASDQAHGKHDGAVVQHMADRVKAFLWVPLLLGLVLLGAVMAGPLLLGRMRR